METFAIVCIAAAIIAVLWFVNRKNKVEEPPMWTPPVVQEPPVQEPAPVVTTPAVEEPVAPAVVAEDIHLLSAVKPEKQKKPRKPRTTTKKKKQ